MRHVRALVAALPLILGAGAIASCSTVLGFEDLTPMDADAGVTSDAPYEAGTDADASQPDADAAPDAFEERLEDVVDDVPNDTLDSDPDAQDATEEEAGCGDTTANPDHCGRCDHSCLGGDCVDGVCQPIKLNGVTDGAWGMAIDDTAVYIAVHLNNEIHAYDKISGGALVLLADLTVEQSPWVAVDSQNIYWSNRLNTNGSIGTCAKTGCVSTSTKLIEGVDRPNGVAADGTSLYWAETNGRAIKKADADGSNIQVLVPDTMSLRPLSITLHGGYVYFTDLAEGRVARVPVDGGVVQTMATSSYPWRVAVADDWVYWTNGESPAGAVFRVPNQDPPDGGHAVETIATGQDGAFGIVVDDDNVYWLATAGWTTAAGALRYCPISGCPGSEPISLDEGIPYPIDLVADDEALYYSVYGINSAVDGEVRKVAKP